MKKGFKVTLIVLLVLALCAGGYFAARKFLFPKEAGGEGAAAYVDSVANIMGLTGNAFYNRFAGVVESQETWSVRANPEYTIKEVKVAVGDEVEVGTPLFTYDIAQFESQLEQADIDLERLNNELTSMQTVLEKLTKEKEKAPSSEQANYTIQIQEQELGIKQKNIDIKSKEMEIAKLKDNMANATVTSGLAGVVKSVNNGTQVDYGNGDDSFITVMQVGDFRIKGTVNEQNMGEIYEGAPILVHSRIDADRIWTGYVQKIDTENTVQNQNMYYGGDTGNMSSNYPFYVLLDTSEGLMLGQHVYMELDMGQGGAEASDALKLMEFYIDTSDPDHPFVWAEEDGKLRKRDVVLGAYDEMMMTYEILSGLTEEDRIAFPTEDLAEGMPTADIAEMPMDEGMYEDAGMYEDGGMYEEGLPEDGMYEEGLPEDGMYEEGMPEDGMYEEGLPEDGMYEEGMPEDDVISPEAVEGEMPGEGEGA